MKIAKVFNNSVVLCRNERGEELVLLGRGLGFQASAGDFVDDSLVERVFAPTGSATADRLAALVNEIPLADIELTERIVQLGRERLGGHVTEHVLIPLADHISFALRRAREGAQIEYPLAWEVAALYPKEHAFGRAALKVIERERAVRLPDVEAVPLALHFVNAQFGASDEAMGLTVKMTQVLGRALEIISEELEVRVDESSVEVARFVTHLRYLFLRDPSTRAARVAEDQLHSALREAKPREYGCGSRIAELLTERFGWEMGEDERLYLALHVARLTAAR